MLDWYNTAQMWIATYGVSFLGAVIILILGFMAAGVCKRMALKLMGKLEMDETLVSFLAGMVKVLVLTFVVIAALNRAGFQTASLVAVVGAAGLAVGLAFKDQLANLAAGVLLLIFRPFKVGDFVEVGGATGTVRAVTLLTTQLNTPDGVVTLIPNTSLTTTVVKNYSAEPVRRIDLVIGVGYGDSLPQTKTLLQQILEDDPRVLVDPAPGVAVMELADSSVNFAVRPWVKTEDYWAVRFELTEKIKLALDEAGLNIPYPQMDLHLIGEAQEALAQN